MNDRPEHFVAKDRARRLAWHLEKVLQERRLAWRGADIGMASVKDEADLALAGIAQDARSSVAAVLEGRMRDRERGYMEIPFAVMATTVATRIERASELESRRRTSRRRTGDREARAQEEILGELTAALRRLRAFSATYDEKRPLPEARNTDLGHVLETIDPGDERPFDVLPPPIASDAQGLEDLLLAVRTALPQADGPWHVERGPRLLLALGDRTGEVGRIATPPDVARAAEVLAFVHPVEVAVHSRTDLAGHEEATGIEVQLEDATGRSLDAAVDLATGSEGRLDPEAEQAVRALLATPPAPEAGPSPPERLVALLGVLRVLDRRIEDRLLRYAATPAVRRVALDVPREPTRKAPLKKRLVEALEDDVPGFPAGRAGDLVAALATGRKLGRLGLSDAVALLALFGRAWSHAGARGQAVLPRGDLSDEEIRGLASDLAEIAGLRQRLETGRTLSPTELTRLERATIGALGHLGRMPSLGNPPRG